jgi:predicted nucleic acid-binding protein
MGEFDVCDCIDRKPENSEELPLLLLKDACCVHPHTLFEILTTRTKLELSRFV